MASTTSFFAVEANLTSACEDSYTTVEFTFRTSLLSFGGELVTTNSDSDIVYLIIKELFLNQSLKQLVKNIKL